MQDDVAAARLRRRPQQTPSGRIRCEHVGSGMHVMRVLHAVGQSIGHGDAFAPCDEGAGTGTSVFARCVPDRQLESGAAQPRSCQCHHEIVAAARLVMRGEPVHADGTARRVRIGIEMTRMTGRFAESAGMRERRPTAVGRRHDDRRCAHRQGGGAQRVHGTMTRPMLPVSVPNQIARVGAWNIM